MGGCFIFGVWGVKGDKENGEWVINGDLYYGGEFYDEWVSECWDKGGDDNYYWTGILAGIEVSVWY